MYAAQLLVAGEPLQRKEIPAPEPGPDEVAVSMAFAGVNPMDRYNAMGSVGADTPLPRTLGIEGVGTLPDGTRVVVSGEGVGVTRDGTWAEVAVVPLSAVVPVPDGVSGPAAACVGVAGLTAWSAVALRAQVTAGDTVLVLGAGGGVGLAAVSLCASRGAQVIGQVGSEAKVEAVHLAGAGTVVTDLALLEEEPTVVLDALGGSFTPVALERIQPLGRYVVYGTSAGAEVTLDWQQVYRKGVTVFGQGNLHFSADERRRHLGDTLAAVADGELVLPVHDVLPLAQANDALAALADRSVVGKIVLTLAPG